MALEQYTRIVALAAVLAGFSDASPAPSRQVKLDLDIAATSSLPDKNTTKCFNLRRGIRAVDWLCGLKRRQRAVLL